MGKWKTLDSWKLFLWYACMFVAQLCLTLCNPMDCSFLGSSIHEISQARTLEWVAISFSRGSSLPRDWNLQADSLPSEPPCKCLRPVSSFSLQLNSPPGTCLMVDGLMGSWHSLTGTAGDILCPLSIKPQTKPMSVSPLASTHFSLVQLLFSC